MRRFSGVPETALLSAPQRMCAEPVSDGSRLQPHQSAQSRLNETGSLTAELHSASRQLSKLNALYRLGIYGTRNLEILTINILKTDK